jgi:perosamine synthetase
VARTAATSWSRSAEVGDEAFKRRNPLPGPTSLDEREGRRPPEYEERLSNAQAALALRQLRRLDENLAHRRRISAVYASHLAPLGGGPPAVHNSDEPAFVRYPLRVPDREAAVRAIAPHAVPGLWFTSVLEEAQTPEHGGYRAATCPTAEAAARTLVNLPTHLRVTEEDAATTARAAATAMAAASS